MSFSYDYKTLPEEILFKRYCEGDIAAFDALLERLKGLVYSLILRSVSEPQIADEIFQEVFLKVCKNKELFRESVSFKSWLVTICKNTCIDHSRKNRRELKTSPLDGDPNQDQRPVSDQIASEDPNPYEELNIKLENKELEALLDRLPEEQRETFYLKVVGDLTFEEIGEAMKCSTNTAKSRYRYALGTLRALVKRQRLLQRAVGQ